MDDDENGILNIELSDEEVDVAKKKADRTGQTEDEFQEVKQDYRARIENGEVRVQHHRPDPPSGPTMLVDEPHGAILTPAPADRYTSL